MPSYNNGRDDFPFAVEAKLVRRAITSKSKQWTDMADKWLITVNEGLYGGTMKIDYYTGIGHRKHHTASPAFGTVAYYEEGKLVAPDANAVLSSIGSDLQTSLEMPADDADAMDYLISEQGAEASSDLLRTIHAMRSNQDKVRKMLRNTGIDLQDFANWAVSLDN